MPLKARAGQFHVMSCVSLGFPTAPLVQRDSASFGARICNEGQRSFIGQRPIKNEARIPFSSLEGVVDLGPSPFLVGPFLASASVLPQTARSRETFNVEAASVDFSNGRQQFVCDSKPFMAIMGIEKPGVKAALDHMIASDCRQNFKRKRAPYRKCLDTLIRRPTVADFDRSGHPNRLYKIDGHAAIPKKSFGVTFSPVALNRSAISLRDGRTSPRAARVIVETATFTSLARSVALLPGKAR